MSMRIMRVTLLLVFAFAAFAFKHECVHDKINKEFKPTVEDLTEEDRQHRLLQSTTTRQIKIVLDESNLVNVTSEQREFIMGKLVPISTTFLSRRLTVRTRGSLLKVPVSNCYQAKVPSSHINTGLDADLIIYVTAKSEPGSNFLAWATSCSLDSVTRRPIAGQVNFNLHFLRLNNTVESFESQVDVTLHEIAHILGFSSGLFQHYQTSFNTSGRLGFSNIVQSNVPLRGANRSVIKTGKVLQTAKNYFQCDNIVGVELENEGSAGSVGSHWERAVLHNELMSASSIVDASFSDFTLSLLQDSGWYQVNFNLSEPMFFGQGAGCRFLNQSCNESNQAGRREWCFNTNEGLCTFNYKAKGYCASETFSDGCKYARGYSNGGCEDVTLTASPIYGEIIAPGSRCVSASIIKKGYQVPRSASRCYGYSCSSGQVKIHLAGGVDVFCPSAGFIAVPPSNSNYLGNITCPDPVSFCGTFYPSCPKGCSSNGYCLQGVCECRAGYSGADCSIIG